MSNRRITHVYAAAAVWLLTSLTASSAGAQTTSAGAQTSETAQLPSGPLTLEQVLTFAEPRSESVSIAREGVQRAEGDQVRARSGRLPQLSASASYDRALASEFEGVFDFSSAPSCPPFTLNQAAPLDARVAEIERAIDCGAVGGGGFFGSGTDGSFQNLPFGRKNTWRATLAFSQSVYSGGRNDAQMKVAEVGRQTADLGLTTSRAQLLFDVTQAYYDAVLSHRLVSIAAATLEQATATLRQTEAGLSAGTQPEFEVLRARVTRDNQLPVLIRQRVSRDIADLRLKQMLDLPADYELRLADVLGGDSLPPPAVFAERVAAVERALGPDDSISLVRGGAPLPDRTAVAQAAATVQLREASLRLAAAQRMPSVAINSTYSRIAYPEGLLPTFNRSNWSIGVSMSVPVMTGGRLRGDELVARAELEQSRLQQRQVEELAALDTRSAWAELIAARAAWEASAGTVQQADRAYQIAEVRYNAGVSTQLELSDARLSRQQADANRAQAARDLQVARARVALLPDLPLAGGAGGAAPTAQPMPQAPSPPQGQPAPQPQGGGQFRNASAQGAQAFVGQ